MCRLRDITGGMNQAIPPHDDGRPHPRGSVSAYWRVAGDYWKGPTSLQAWSLTIIGLVLVIGNIVVQYGINLWNRSFFNALQQRDQSFVYRAIVIFVALAFAAALVAVLQLVFRMRLQILWRQWLTRRLVASVAERAAVLSSQHRRAGSRCTGIPHRRGREGRHGTGGRFRLRNRQRRADRGGVLRRVVVGERFGRCSSAGASPVSWSTRR